MLSAAPASATAPGENGRIAYRLFLNEEQTHAAILTIRPNGTDKRWLTHPRRPSLSGHYEKRRATGPRR